MSASCCVVPFQRRDDLLQQLFFLFLFGSATITISMIAVYRLGNPLGRFQEATLRLAGDLDAPPLDERRGVSEVRAVAQNPERHAGAAEELPR